MARRRLTSYDILIVGIFTLLAAGSWVTFDIYRSLTKTTIPKVLQSQIRPLDADIDPNLIDNLRSRRIFDDNTLNSVQSLSAEPDIQEAPVRTLIDSGSLTATPSANPAPTIVETSPPASPSSNSLP